MAIYAKLPNERQSEGRKSIELEFKDKGGVFLLRTLNLQSNEYFALRDAFYKQFKQEDKICQLSTQTKDA